MPSQRHTQALQRRLFALILATFVGAAAVVIVFALMAQREPSAAAGITPTSTTTLPAATPLLPAATPTSGSPYGPTARCIAAEPGTPLHAMPDATSATYGDLSTGEEVSVLFRTADGPWLQVLTHTGVSGWVAPGTLALAVPVDSIPLVAATASAVATPTAPTTITLTVDTNGLRLRRGPATSAAVLTTLEAGNTLTALGRHVNGDWLLVETSDGLRGWVSADFVAADSDLVRLPVADAGLVSTSVPASGLTLAAVYLRTAPGTDANPITLLEAGTTLSVYGWSDDGAWLSVASPVGEGWVVAEWVSLAGSSTATATAPAPATVAASTTPMLTPTLAVASPTPPDTATPVPGTATPAATDGALAGGELLPAGTYANLYNVSGAAATIYARGQAQGQRPLVFSKIGDSITAGPESAFMAFCSPNRNFGAYPQLANVVVAFSAETIRENRTSFNLNSAGAGNGWGATEILNPEKVESDLCLPGESPLACEYRLTRPSIALIMIGTNDSGGIAADTYRSKLNQIVAFSSDSGVVPVLFTIPPKRFDPATDGRVDEFNRIIIETATAWRIPLIDYHALMMQAPNLGLSEDGVHPSDPLYASPCDLDAGNLQYGSNIRNLLALQMLELLWQRMILP